jgi:hypothetical protein
MARLARVVHPSPMRGALHASTLLLACTVLGSTHARAQSCHAPLGRGELAGGAVTLRLSEGTVDVPGRDATYQSAVLGVGYGAPRYELLALLPAHRLDDAQATHVGLGDAVLDARAALFRSTDRSGPVRESFALGVELAASLPTGSSAHRLGSGHVMLMPGVYARVRDEHASLLAQAGYARALQADDHDAVGHGHAPGSLVDPMNASELTSALSFALPFAQSFALLASLAAALPLATEGGAARAAGGLGASWELSPLELALKLELPLIGGAFEQRVTLGVTLSP